jgi:predicted kinase
MTTLRFSTPRRTLIVPVGIPGSGKSTLLNQVARAHNDPGFRFGGDDVRLAMYGAVATQGSPRDVHFAVRAMAGVRLAVDMPVAVDSTSVGAFERSKLLELGSRHQATCIALLSQVPTEVSFERNAARDEAYRVPEFVLDKMAATVASATSESLLSEGFSAVYVFDENTTDLVIDFEDH